MQEHVISLFYKWSLGSEAEVEDLKRAYLETDASIEQIMEQIPHSTQEDEDRFVRLINSFIKDGSLPSSKAWQKSIKDEKARVQRKKRSEKEAKEAEELAKDVGLWDDFYGDGKKPNGDVDAKRSGSSGGQAEEDDYSALQAVILKKKAKTNTFFDDLAAKYGEPKSSRTRTGKKKRSSKDKDTEGDEAVEGPLPKKSKLVAEAPDIDDEEFAKLQQKLFCDSDNKKATKLRGKKTRR